MAKTLFLCSFDQEDLMLHLLGIRVQMINVCCWWGGAVSEPHEFH